MTAIRMKTRTLILTTALAAASWPAWGDPVGRVLAVAGSATVDRAGRQVALQPGSMIESGDTLAVGERGTLQVRFTDESIVALRANSQFRVENYRFENNAETDRSLLGLLKGGMRTITGVIGRANQKNYSVQTPTSTIGIRGTHFTVVSCDNDCRNPDGSAGLNGTFGGVTDGRIEVSNASGKQEFSQQDYFYVPNADTPPVRLLAPPSVLSDRSLVISSRKPAAATTAAAQESAGNETAATGSSGTQTSTSPQLVAQTAPVTQLTSPLTTVAATAQPAVVSASSLSNRISNVEINRTSGANGQINGLQVLALTRTVTELRTRIDNIDIPRLFTDAASLAAELRAAPSNPADPFVLIGSSAAAAAYWGYSPPVAGSTNLNVDHVAFGDTPTVALPGAGTAQYNFVGGTPPTDNFGRTGTLSGATALLMDFSARQIKSASAITISFDTNAQQSTPTVYSLPSTARLSMNAGAQTWAGATCTAGCVATSVTTATVNGTFVGASAQGFVAGIAVSNNQLNTGRPHYAGTVGVFAK